MHLNYKHLRYFWAVAHEGNLTRAAERLNVSQSALSTQIQKLEEQLGHSLFERSGRKLHLTEAGHITLDHADTVFAVGEELVASLRDAPSRKRQTLRIGASFNLSRNFQLRFLEPVLGNPDVHVVVHSGRLQDLLIAIEAHELDIVLSNVLPLRDASTAWFSKLIDEQPVSFIGRPDWDYDGLDFAGLIERFPLVVPALGSGIRSDLDTLLDSLDLKPKILTEADDMAMLRLLARSRIGLAVIPPIVVRDELDTAFLKEILPIPNLQERFFAITRTRRFPNQIVQELIEKAI